MRDQAVGQADALSLALAEPDQHVRHRWILGLTLASLGMWMATQTPLQVMLALQLQDITPKHKIVALGVVTGVGAISSALATPIVGMLSDRTAHGQRIGRFSGRRHRWTLVMAVLAAACMVVLAEQATVFGVALLWFLFSAFQNGEYATLSAAIPDHVPVRQRATVAGWVGMPIALGLVLGTVLVVDVLDQRLVAGYVTLAVLMVLLALPFVLFTPDYPLAPHDREPFSWRRLASSYWLSPRAYPDFGWAWLTRFLTSLAIAMGTLYLLYFLRDAVHYARLFPGQTAADGLLILILIYTGCVVLDCDLVEIGARVKLGPGVQLLAVSHPLDATQRALGLEYGEPITIGDDVWIGGGAIVLGGVTIGDRAVVGAGSVVTRDVAPDTVVAGNPARPIRALEPVA